MNIKNYAEALGIANDDTEMLENLRDVLSDVVALCASRAGMVDDGAAHAVMDLLPEDDYSNDDVTWSEPHFDEE